MVDKIIYLFGFVVTFTYVFSTTARIEGKPSFRWFVFAIASGILYPIFWMLHNVMFMVLTEIVIREMNDDKKKTRYNNFFKSSK